MLFNVQAELSIHLRSLNRLFSHVFVVVCTETYTLRYIHSSFLVYVIVRGKLGGSTRNGTNEGMKYEMKRNVRRYMCKCLWWL